MITERIKNVTPSATIELEGIVAQLEASGVNVINLNAGEPDFNTPERIIAACEKAMRQGKTKYAPVTGIKALRESVSKKLETDNAVSYDPDRIVICTGAKQALHNAVLTVVNPGDEVIIPIPCWVSYVEMVKLAQGIPVLVDMPDYSLNIDLIKNAVTERTRAIIINTPNNPTGAVYTSDSMKKLGELAVEHDFYIISDEVYEKLVYDDAEHLCIASLSPEIKRHCIVVNGFSKAYAMTGWRLGYCAAEKDVIRGIASLQGHTTSNSTTFVQWAAVEALNGPQNELESMRKQFDKRRKYLYRRLNAIPGISCGVSKGAFYLMPNVKAYYGKIYGNKTIENSVDLCAFLLSEARLAVVPGLAFYAPDTIRIAYSNSLENIASGMDAMEKAMELLS